VQPCRSPGSVRASLVEAIAGLPTRIRTDLDVPVLVVQTEGDLFSPLAYRAARQPDTDRLRTWEIAGSAHSDAFMIGDFEPFLGCPKPVNHGQQAYVLRAGLRRLVEWVRAGTPPPTGPPLDLDGDAYVRDRHGNVRGGVRTPVVDAAAEVLSGLPVPGASPICGLFGSSTPLAGAWADRAAYLVAYARATEAAIDRGFLLADDRDAILAEARPELVDVHPTIRRSSRLASGSQASTS
jgi:Alpha/beta hydrolase domain